MKTLLTQSIARSIKENFKAYPESYPTSGDGPSDDAISSLVNWVEGEFENETEDKDKGTIAEWFEIAIRAYIDFFDFEDQEPGDTYNYCKEQVEYVRTKS